MFKMDLASNLLFNGLGDYTICGREILCLQMKALNLVYLIT